MFDLNNDGFKDVFTANAHVMDNEELYSSRTFRQPNIVFVNAGNARFAAATAGSAARAHRGCAFGDFDNDGRIDVATSSLNEPAELLRNISGDGQHWLQLLLTGTRSNKNAIGARVRLVRKSGAAQHNHVSTAVGYASSSTRRVHFGLGKVADVARIEITWPSGKLEVIENIAADQLLRITEPE